MNEVFAFLSSHQVFEVQCVFYPPSLVQFKSAILQVLTASHTWPKATILDNADLGDPFFVGCGSRREE